MLSSPSLLDDVPPPGDPSPVLNVFEHQRFRVHRPDGTRLTRSFREIVTAMADDGSPLGDEALALDYPQEFFNVAALSLMAALAQRLFEPDTPGELAERVAAPIVPDAFERAICDLRPHYALVGPGPRFMQGPEAPPGKKAGPIADALFLTYSKPGATQNDKRFLYRADADWGVAPDQAALLLYARNTFYEGQGGGGPDPYFKGVTGNTPVRSLVTVPAGGALDLRRTLWLNVLSRQAQEDIPGAFPDAGEGYDGRFWEAPPPGGNVPLGTITLAAGLFWMTAHHRLHFEPVGDAPAVCVVTGEPITDGLVARTVTKWSTRTAFNKGDKANKGKRAEGLFRHPNVPTWRRYDREAGQYESLERPYAVLRQTGLVDALGGAVFGARPGHGGRGRLAAPAVAQTRTPAVQSLRLHVQTLVFGFHMLGDQTTHGAFERDEVLLPIAGGDPGRVLAQLDAATEIMEQAGQAAHRMADRLRKAVHQTAGVTGRDESPEGQISPGPDTSDYKARAEAKVVARDVLAAYWRSIQDETQALVASLAAQAAAPDGLTDDAGSEIATAWARAVYRTAIRLYEPVFVRYAAAARTMPLAHRARARYFPDDRPGDDDLPPDNPAAEDGDA